MEILLSWYVGAPVFCLTVGNIFFWLPTLLSDGSLNARNYQEMAPILGAFGGVLGMMLGLTIFDAPWAGYLLALAPGAVLFFLAAHRLESFGKRHDPTTCPDFEPAPSSDQ